jgi:hypothetical protein
MPADPACHSRPPFLPALFARQSCLMFLPDVPAWPFLLSFDVHWLFPRGK